MINYDELKTALTDISNICRMTDCPKCPFRNDDDMLYCKLVDFTPNNWIDIITEYDMQQFADRGAHLVKGGYLDE